MKIRHIGLILCLVGLLVLGLTACNVGPGPAGPNPPAGGTFTVTFTGVSGIDPQQVATNGFATEPADDPAKEGYTFDGWYLGNNPYDFSTPVTSDITLKAKFSLKAYTIDYDLVYDDAKNNAQNPATYTVEDDITFKAPTHPEYTFMGWSIKSIAAGDMTGNITVVASWGYEPVVNIDFEGMRIHYAELNNSVDSDGNPTGEEYVPAIPGTENQYYVNAGGTVTSTTAAYICAEYKDRVDFTDLLVTCWKARHSPVYIEADPSDTVHKNYLTFKQDSANPVNFNQPINQPNNGFEDYDISVLVGLGDTGVASDNVLLSFDFYMSAEGVIPVMVYARSGNAFRHTLVTIDTNGDLYVGWDAVNSDRVAYYNANGTKVTKTKVGTAAVGEWHTLRFELSARRQQDGYDVVIKLDGEQLGDNAFTLKTEGLFDQAAEKHFNQFMLFGGGKTSENDGTATDLGNCINDAIAAKGGTYKAEYRFDNFVVSALLLPPQ